ncbi:MAG: ribosome silencing factor [Bacteroidetes bacterium]|nr:ribosome silencing factor [Bacteroidota bacterium]
MVKSARVALKLEKNAVDLLSEAIIKGLLEKKGKEIVLMDLRGLSGAVTDFFIVCQGDSSTQVEALSRSVEEVVEIECGDFPAHIEGKNNAQWVLIDYINVIVHIFQPEQRDYYGIEKLWADAEIRIISGN